jgi:hypothetical protein
MRLRRDSLVEMALEDEQAVYDIQALLQASQMCSVVAPRHTDGADMAAQPQLQVARSSLSSTHSSPITERASALTSKMRRDIRHRSNA